MLGHVRSSNADYLVFGTLMLGPMYLLCSSKHILVAYQLWSSLILLALNKCYLNNLLSNKFKSHRHVLVTLEEHLHYCVLPLASP